MTARSTRLQDAEARTRAALNLVGREIRLTRKRHDLSQEAVARSARVSRSKVSRAERARSPRLTIADASAMLAIVGLDLVVRTSPGGDPIRDAGHAALLARFRARLHPSLRWATEVPLPMAGDRRAWDAMVNGDGWRVGVEAELHPDDLQALERKLALKLRDGGVDRLVLLLRDSEANRRFIREHGAALRVRFPLAGRRAMELLAAAAELPADSIVLL